MSGVKLSYHVLLIYNMGVFIDVLKHFTACLKKLPAKTLRKRFEIFLTVILTGIVIFLTRIQQTTTPYYL